MNQQLDTFFRFTVLETFDVPVKTLQWKWLGDEKTNAL